MFKRISYGMHRSSRENIYISRSAAVLATVTLRHIFCATCRMSELPRRKCGNALTDRKWARLWRYNMQPNDCIQTNEHSYRSLHVTMDGWDLHCTLFRRTKGHFCTPCEICTRRALFVCFFRIILSSIHWFSMKILRFHINLYIFHH